MIDKSVFSDDEWRAIADAPLRTSGAMFAAGDRRPISMVKEASASARAGAGASKDVSANEQATINRIAALFQVTGTE